MQINEEGTNNDVLKNLIHKFNKLEKDNHKLKTKIRRNDSIPHIQFNSVYKQ